MKTSLSQHSRVFAVLPLLFLLSCGPEISSRSSQADARPRLISDNGGQYISKDFKEFIGQKNFTHVTTAPAYPESNGKQERFFRTVKEECLRPQTPLDVDDARRVVSSYIDHYNGRRLHSALGYITPADKLAGRADEIFAERDRKLEEARARRADARREARQNIRAQLVS